MFCAYFIFIYFYLIGHQRPDEAFSALSIKELSSSEEGESDQTQELKQGLTREDQLSGRTNNNKKFRSFKSKENIHRKKCGQDHFGSTCQTFTKVAL